MAFAAEAGQGGSRHPNGASPLGHLRSLLGWRVLLVLLGVVACGGRTSLLSDEELDASGGGSGEQPQTCMFDRECQSGSACQRASCQRGLCREVPVDCDDRDPCTDDVCDSARGCTYRSVSADVDGDGHRSPRAGFLPGVTGACGDDCDDRNRLVFPGNPERCDGLDNDCNGLIDEGLVYGRPSAATQISSPRDRRAALGGLAQTSSSFVLSYSARRETRSENFLTLISANLARTSETPITNLNADTFAGPVVFSGSSLATVWEDARQDTNYEVYFALFDPEGRKLGPELRVSDAPGFSLNPKIVWGPSEYFLVWDDRRAETMGQGDRARIYGQRISADGNRLGPNVPLTAAGTVAEFPDLALAPERAGLVFVSSNDVPRLSFRLLDRQLNPVGAPSAPLGENVQSPSVYFLEDRFVVLFNTYDQRPGDSLWGAVYDARGALLVAPRRLTEGARFARSHDALVLDDRLLVVWADDRDGNYELYSQVLASDLSVLSPRRRLTRDPADSVGPSISRGPNGTIGIAFTDYRTGSNQTYLLTLSCQ